MTEILKRKADHIDLVLKQRLETAAQASPWDKIQLTHNALPEKDVLNFDLTSEFLGKQLRRPFLISSMTGGPLKAEKINAHLAEAAQDLGIAMGVGSQRVALLSAGDGGLTGHLRRWAPDIPLYANLGAAQLRNDFSLSDVQRAIDMIEADALIIHLNCLQELMQEDGDTDWRGLLNAIETVARFLDVPVVAKEVGMGISSSTAIRLVDAGVQAIDVAGKGGTNFIQVEASRTANSRLSALGEVFRDWGINTPDAVQSVRASLPHIPIIASGGIRHGLDAAKAIKLGANVVAQAGPVLQAATESTQAVLDHFEFIESALRIGLVCSDD